MFGLLHSFPLVHVLNMTLRKEQTDDKCFIDHTLVPATSNSGSSFSSKSSTKSSRQRKKNRCTTQLAAKLSNENLAPPQPSKNKLKLCNTDKELSADSGNWSPPRSPTVSSCLLGGED